MSRNPVTAMHVAAGTGGIAAVLREIRTAEGTPVRPRRIVVDAPNRRVLALDDGGDVIAEATDVTTDLANALLALPELLVVSADDEGPRASAQLPVTSSPQGRAGQESA